MKREEDREFHCPVDTWAGTELRCPCDEAVEMGMEFSETEMPGRPDKEYAVRDWRSRREGSRAKRRLFAPIAAVMGMAAIVFSSFDCDPLGEDWLSIGGNGVVEASEEDVFPRLSNLEPNGFIEGCGVLNEEYIRIQSETEDLFVVSGRAWGYWDGEGNWNQAPVSSVPGVRYDEASNTLTLDNYTGPVLNVNLMGNGFTIELIGENRLDHLIVWGFYYGGSVKITGDGSLTINRDGLYDMGIDLNAEFSQTCLMIDSEVTLEVYGSEMAVCIHGSNMEKGIYYPPSVELTGGVPIEGDFIIVENGLPASAFGDFRDFTIGDPETGEPAKHVLFR